MPITVAELNRHPVKSLGEERLEQVALAPGAAMPGDRLYAMLHGRAAADARAAAEAGRWAPCESFVRVTHAPRLAQLETRFDPETQVLRLSHPDQPPFEAALDAEAGRAALAAWAAPLLGDAAPGPHLVVPAGPGVAFTDADLPAISLSSRASLRALSARAGLPLAARRFRGDLWFDGAPPWAEFDWIGRELRIGGARLRVVEPITRCLATAANPETGRRDAAPNRLLREMNDDGAFGVLAEVIDGGDVAIGDAVVEP